MSALALFIGRVIAALFEHYERVNCPGCSGSGWSAARPGFVYSGQGSYDMICDECGGQSASADTSYFTRVGGVSS